jgi:hypothetical protein
VRITRLDDRDVDPARPVMLQACRHGNSGGADDDDQDFVVRRPGHHGSPVELARPLWPGFWRAFSCDVSINLPTTFLSPSGSGLGFEDNARALRDKFADSPPEKGGFEPPVPLEEGSGGRTSRHASQGGPSSRLHLAARAAKWRNVRTSGPPRGREAGGGEMGVVCRFVTHCVGHNSCNSGMPFAGLSIS